MVSRRKSNIRLVVLFFAAGTAIVQYSPTLLSNCWWLITIPLVWLFRGRIWGHLICIFLIGIGWATFRAFLILDQGLPETLETRDIVIEGVVRSLPVYTERYLKFDLDVEKLTHGDRHYPSPGRVRLRYYHTDVEVRAGQRWRFLARLKRPHGFQNPGGFDYEAWLLRQRIRAVGYVRKGPTNRYLGRNQVSLHAIRQGLRDRIYAATADAKHTGLLAALVVGDRSGITEPERETLRRTGTSHLIAISGLHIGLVAGLVYCLAGYLWRLGSQTSLYCPAPRFAAAAGLLAAVLYAALAGFSIPTQRAVIMLSLVMGALMTGRITSGWRLLSFALLAVLIWDPHAVIDPSMWLSFGALCIILYLIAGKKRVGAKWRHWIGLQFALSLGMIPLIMSIFHFASLVSPIANLITIPLFTILIVPLTLVASFLLVFNFWTAGAFCLAVVTGILERFWPLLSGLAQSKLAIWHPSIPSTSALICCAIGMIWLLAPRAVPAKWLSVIWFLPLLTNGPQELEPGEVKMTVLDVGQGLAVVIQTATRSVVYDTGARFSDRFDIGKAVLIPFLQAQGINKVDTLVISHGDNDHIGGLESLLQRYMIDNRLTSVPHHVPHAKSCIPEHGWTQDGVLFKILSPIVPDPPEHNNSSCVIHVISPYGTAMLTGDIEATREGFLVEKYGFELKSDVLLIPHQGSKTSSTDPFLAAVQPMVAVVSTGYRNAYGHPNTAVMNRYHRLGVSVYNTAETGAINVILGANGITYDTHRESHARYWFTKKPSKSVTLFR